MKVLAAALVVVVAVGCSSDGTDDGPQSNIRTLSPPADGPYVSVAVDNHFHDIHPLDNKEIAADRAFVVRNEGRNLHNVSISKTDISVDIKEGESFRVDPVSELGPPGTYKIFCNYHTSDGMRGQITIVEEGAE